MDSITDTSTHLTEISFDDLIDTSPVKKMNKSAYDSDEDMRSTHRKDDSLNTPVLKKTQVQMHGRSAPINPSSISTKPTPMRSNTIKPGSSLSSTAKVNSSSTGSATSGPVLLNSKNLLPKTATPIGSNSIKITPKGMAANSGSAAGSSGGPSFSGSAGALPNRTAVRTSSGQLIYIQKYTAPGAATNSPKTSATNTIGLKSQIVSGTTAASSGSNNSAGAAAGSKPMTIQVMRTADGSFVPMKSSTAGTAAKNTTLTLSPSALAGKKLVTSNQLLIKAAVPSAVNASAANKTLVRATTSAAASSGENVAQKSKTIVVQSQSAGHKHLSMSTASLAKLAPKTQITNTSSQAATASGSTGSATSAHGHGQLHALKISGKPGVQYVRVFPSNKVAAKSAAASSAAGSATTTTAAKTVVASNTHGGSNATTGTPVKILNNLPQKFTVLQKGTGTKIVVTQKRESSGGSPVASKVQKTIVTVPTVRSLTDDRSRPQQQSLIRPQQQQNASPSSSTGQQSLIRKHKISEINSELKRITTSDSQEERGQPEAKKFAAGNRVVVISSGSGEPKILNSGVSLQERNKPNSGAIQVQSTKTAQSSMASASVSNTTSTTHISGKQHYTILKSSGTTQPTTIKAHSVLKTSQSPSSSESMKVAATETVTTTAPGPMQQKSLINKQSLLQQQQKMQQLRQLQKTRISQSIAAKLPSGGSSSLAAVRIKDEPAEGSAVKAEVKANSNSVFATPAPPPPPPSSSATAAVSMETPASESPEDPNKLDMGAVRRKHCNCSKSQCLKLYCDCFANGEFCQDCTCKDCCNNLENEDERQKAIKSCLDRNPNAFKPKITSSSDMGDMRLHNKGCNCKRSGCLKNYCECYEAKIPCSSNCKCVGCRNFEERADLDMDPIDSKLIVNMGNTSLGMVKRSGDRARGEYFGSQGGIKTEKGIIKQEPGLGNGGASSPSPDKQQCNFITQEVVDATIQCMITQADECEKNGLPAYQTEKMVMEELGRCLVEIIDFSIRNADSSYSQD